MIFLTEVETVIVYIFYILLFSLAVYAAGSVCKKETGKQGYGTAFFLSLIFILVLFLLIQPYVFGPYIPTGWIQLIVIFIFLFVLFLIFYNISAGGALLAAIICLVVLWVLGILIGWLFGLFELIVPPIFTF